MVVTIAVVGVPQAGPFSALDGDLLVNERKNKSTRVGVAIPHGGRVLGAELRVLDAHSNGWAPPETRPNLPVSEFQYEEADGARFFGWRVNNRDENLPRLLKADVHWEGPDESQQIVISEVARAFQTATPLQPVITPWHVSLALAVRDDVVHQSSDYEVRNHDPHGSIPTWVPSLEYLTGGWVTRGDSLPELPGHRHYRADFANGHTSQDRVVRVRFTRA